MKEIFNALCKDMVIGALAFATLAVSVSAMGYSVPILPLLAATNTYPLVKFVRKVTF